MAQGHIQLLLNWYELQGKNLIGEEELRGLDIDGLLQLFDEPFWNGLYQCWAVEAQHVAKLQKHLQHTLQLERYAYFIEAIKFNNYSPV